MPGQGHREATTLYKRAIHPCGLGPIPAAHPSMATAHRNKLASCQLLLFWLPGVSRSATYTYNLFLIFPLPLPRTCFFHGNPRAIYGIRRLARPSSLCLLSLSLSLSLSPALPLSVASSCKAVAFSCLSRSDVNFETCQNARSDLIEISHTCLIFLLIMINNNWYFVQNAFLL